MIKPYWESEHGKIYNCDCLDVLPELESAELLLTDPPYGHTINCYERPQLRYKGMMAEKTDYGDLSWNNIISSEHINIILKKSKNSILFGANYYSSMLPNSGCWLIWDKDNGNTNFADCELAWTSFLDKASRKIKYRWNGMLQENGGRFKEKRYHPTQKPVGLFMQILQKYAKPGWTILDCFAGSGTTALACERMPEMKFKWILIEQDKEYADIAVKRIEQETRQLRLFK
jgi:site-specific DNA-methyltransferase (adenine-specific)